MSDKFTAQDYRELSEALDKWEWYRPVLSDRARGDLEPMAAAARRFRDRYQICPNPECENGSLPDNTTFTNGESFTVEVNYVGGVKKAERLLCLTCGGSGLVPNQERLEQAGYATFVIDLDVKQGGSETWSILTDHSRNKYLDMAAAAVRAFDKKPT